MSFKVNNLTELRAVRDKAAAAGASDFIGLNHGNAWSVYFNDPEENRIEVYLDTPFHTPQPCGEPLNLEQSDDALLAETKRSEEHTSELQSLMRISYAVFFLQKKKT